MSAIQPKQQSLDSQKPETERSWMARFTGKSAGAAVVQLGVMLAGAESKNLPGLCSRCQGYRNPQSSSARYPSIFCSEQCEREFISAALASITVDDCIRIHQRLDSLLMSADGQTV